jgi:hypothetical protein
MKLITSIVLVVCGFIFFCCDPDVEIPAYIYVENVDLVADFNKQGTSSSKIPNIWVTVKGKDIGTYTLPALVPVIGSGNTEISIEAGIKLNGLSQQRPKYYLYKPHKQTINLRKGMVDTISPVFQYLDGLTFALKEDFESAGLAFSSIKDTITRGAELTKTQDSALLFRYPNEINHFSGIIQLPYEDTIYHFEIKTTEPLRFNSLSATDCFVEMNYRFTENVEIGIYAYSSSYTTRQYSICNIVGTQNSQWGKIYVNLTDIMSDATVNQEMTHFDIYMKSGVSRNSTARFLFDNIKVVHR